MAHLNPKKLHVAYLHGVGPKAPIVRRRYTLTHSDITGDLYLTIGCDYNLKQVSGWYTRFMRDEILAEWIGSQDAPSLNVYCHVSGGIVLGRAAWRLSIFKREMPLVLEAIRYGDKELFTEHPDLDNSPIIVHFKSSKDKYDIIEEWGVLGDYQP